MNEIKKGDWIEVTIRDSSKLSGDFGGVCRLSGFNGRVLGFNEKGINIFDGWDMWLVEWRDIDSIKKQGDGEEDHLEEYDEIVKRFENLKLDK